MSYLAYPDFEKAPHPALTRSVKLCMRSRLIAAVLTTIAMAALGLGVDVRTVAKAGPRVATAVTLSLVVLAVISYALIRLTGVA